MTAKETALLNGFRNAPACELCGRPNPGKLEPHHVRARGIGGGHTCHHPMNLMSLCHTCHVVVECEGTKGVLMILVARREGVDRDEASRQVREALNAQRDA